MRLGKSKSQKETLFFILLGNYLDFHLKNAPSRPNSPAGLGVDTDSGHVITCCEFFDQYPQVTLHKFAAQRLHQANLVTDGQQLLLYNLAKGRKKTQSHTAAASVPPLHGVCLPYFTSAVLFFPRVFFTFCKAHLHAQHTPGS